MPTVRFAPTDRSVDVASGTTLLDAARAAGLPVGSSCGADGVCGRCGLVVASGADGLSTESEHERRVKEMNRVEAGARLSCLARVVGDVVVTARYW